MTVSDENVEQATGSFSRRNVVGGMAFAVPTIMAVGAAPAMAASGVNHTSVKLSGSVVSVTVNLTGIPKGSSRTVTIKVSDEFQFSGSNEVTVNQANSKAEFTLTASNAPNNPKITYVVTYVVSPGGLTGTAGTFTY